MRRAFPPFAACTALLLLTRLYPAQVPVRRVDVPRRALLHALAQVVEGAGTSVKDEARGGGEDEEEEDDGHWLGFITLSPLSLRNLLCSSAPVDSLLCCIARTRSFCTARGGKSRPAAAACVKGARPCCSAPTLSRPLTRTEAAQQHSHGHRNLPAHVYLVRPTLSPARALPRPSSLTSSPHTSLALSLVALRLQEGLGQHRHRTSPLSTWLHPRREPR